MMKRNNRYIWYCPKRDCNAIVVKTYKPFIVDGIFKCKKCKEIITPDRLARYNLGRNLNKFVDN